MINRLIIAISFIAFCCSSEAQLQNKKQTDFGTFEYSDQDSKTVDDLIKVCNEKLPIISKTLNTRIDPGVAIEIYPDQEAYDKNIMTPELKGSPAVSGNGRIQLVSPLAKIKIDTISYENRLMFLIHEFVHIFLDQIRQPVPVFLDEGLACYFGSYDFYYSITGKFKEYLTERPSVDQLTAEYSRISAADVYSFLFVDFLIRSESTDKISMIIRNPEILRSKDPAWKKYLVDYQNK